HTIKGSSLSIELHAVAQVAHEFETLLDAVRMGRVEVGDTVLDAFDEAANMIGHELSRVARGESGDDGNADVTSADATSTATMQTLLERLRRLAHAAPSVEGSEKIAFAVGVALPEEITASLSEYEQHRLREAMREEAHVFAATVSFDLATFDEDYRSLKDALTEHGEVISTLPDMQESAPDRINFRIVYATTDASEEVARRAATLGQKFLAITQLNPVQSEPDANAHSNAVAPVEREESATGEVEAAEQEQKKSALVSPASLTTLVRVSLDDLDELISATHELFTDTISAFDDASPDDSSQPLRIEEEIRRARISRRFRLLEERLVELRMVAVVPVLERAARAAAAAARAEGKEIDIETKGGEARLDKSLADAIADPLLHLLRNAVDHGIESPPERRRAGKPERGQIKIETIAEGSRVVVRITDDGRGIDPERVRRAAIEKGVIEEGARLSSDQHLRLIFRPGFSTAEQISNISGRGVGLDVVEQTVERIGGELRLQSEVGRGTTFEMRLPTTMALLSSLVVRSNGQMFCVDSTHILEAGFVGKDEPEFVGEGRVVRWRESVLPFVTLRELLGQPPTDDGENEERLPVIVTPVAGREASAKEEETGARRMAAVAIDGWSGHQEILVRGLGSHATRWRGVSGATELSDGRVALLLDLPRLLEMNL
ncbi:MAG: chemotaxis protein CheW, partial [Pyrinomonadaceae bacterium]|nr:chemotaxis protein CheW [Pyrinomonadaceae bacterium]